MELFLMRHGQTETNASGRLLGRADVPLNKEGEKQAREAGALLRERNLSFDLVLASPLRRAVRTAELATGETVQTDARLLEYDLGPLDGKDMKELFPVMDRIMQDDPPDGVEKLSDLKTRLQDLIDELYPKYPEGRVLLVTHAIAMRGFLSLATGFNDGRVYGVDVDYCSIVRSVYDGRSYTKPEWIR